MIIQRINERPICRFFNSLLERCLGGQRRVRGVLNVARTQGTVASKETVRMTIWLRGAGDAFTDWVKGTVGQECGRRFPRTWMPDPRQTTRTFATERLPAAPAAMPHAAAISLADGAVYSSSPAHRLSATAGRRKNRDREATRQAAPLATWEDEGGATAFVE